MKAREFDYRLPHELIAQRPLEKRDTSRLLVLNKKTGEISHEKFYNIINYLKKGDVLVLNDTRVIPARLIGVRDKTFGKIEFLLLNRLKLDTYECLAKPGKRAQIGTSFIFGDGLLVAEVIDIYENGNRVIKFTHEGVFEDILNKLGEMPLPPYITEKLDDSERYQTVYSKSLGSSAAPTAGLHFTEKLLDKIKEKGVIITYLTLHVGLGTFRPVSEVNIEDHDMHSEFYSLSKESAEIINKAKDEGRKIISVGTTSTRTLESVAKKDGRVFESSGYTDIFIYPGYKFKCIDSLITNFHLPESTLIMLVSALAGKENTMNAYKVAVDEKYRFFSFGDSMFIKE
ncbi:MAG: tRNA preQ1(34) S-adenosylmethionine ribosyltransferase-isomerase QueA [Clostridium sp.]|nr:tRNA preQ1(34) S-adenosylmethionine ribosyltransferase-isomerase QueA [Clostridium sp.]